VSAAAAPPVAGAAPLHDVQGVHQRLPFTAVRYEVVGEEGAPAVMALGGISATRHVAGHPADPTPGWWEAQVGAGRSVATERFRAIGVDYLGAELQPGDAVPLVATHDQARAIAAAMDALGIERLHALVGASYGGMVALAFAELFPSRLARLVVISAAHQPHPMATAVRSVQRRIVRDAAAAGRPAQGLALARALAMTTYRTDREFAARFDAGWRLEHGTARFPVEEYLDHCGRRYVEQCTAERFLCLSQSIDLHRVNPAAVRVPATLAAVHGDPIAPPWQMAELAAGLGAPARLHELRSQYGHDAFLKEDDVIASLLTRALDDDA
jgi:homoserine O-acetyltransferase/O-succinyltransferase